ncbi:PTS glucose transporter subunit IIA [Paenibacillus sp. PK3_47]|uniref:PTS sugar transporter subunit IIA n=1 Tax=Paenibacillus sp. PK3_47 TaxID=2072642 RepID=UPI00201D5DE4|nr:PTS glucose transporter subunit IIA [Paenibacillus sp. PK3_47]UQZ36563.1 PTS glucose transporter subunit IIA [Paenibacillus sp. PK3_47]
MFSKWKSKKEEQHTEQQIEIMAPVSGQALPLAEVPDETFAGGHMGSGVAIKPAEGILKAPFDGTVAHIVKTNHALILEHPSGLQLLLHIGIDTVSLKGSAFVSRVQTGDRVTAGETLIEFDLEAIHAAGLQSISPIIVTLTEEIPPEVVSLYGQVTAGQDPVLRVASKQ